MPKIFTSEKQKIGETGENIAVKFIIKHNFHVLDRNYTKKWGEIDIVAEKDDKLYFIEVKSVSCETESTSPKPLLTPTLSRRKREFNREGETHNVYRPEDNMHPQKMKRLARVTQTYLLSKKIPDNKEWQVDLLVVYLDFVNKKAKIRRIENLIL